MVETLLKEPPRKAEPHRAAFERLIEPAAARQPAWLATLRRAAIDRFGALGFPTVQDEDWRFTNVAPIAKLPFRPVLGGSAASVPPAVLDGFAFARLAACRLVFVNGHFAPALSHRARLPEGVVVGSLAEVLARQPDRLEPHLGRYARLDDGFAALNGAFFQDGACVLVPDGQAVETPIHLLFVTTAQEPGTTILPRNLIVAGAGSRLTVVESAVSLAAGRVLTSAVTELVVGDGARVEHLKFQDESAQAYHVATLHAHVGHAANAIAHSFALGARLARNNIQATLAGEGLECVLNGLYLTRGDQLADHHMIVEHAQPNCASHEYFNGILDDCSKGVFHGRILVRPLAQKTDAKQTNKNLLLSDEATANTKPQLEIYADDVRCTHGATIGQMDDDSIFYLRARGIGLATARRMLMHAFAGEIIERVRCEPVREELDRLVWDRLEQNPHIARVDAG
jgi:Fe-S cluster assembly protein SufD